MIDDVRRIGLSLGADVCWPIAYTEIMKRLDLRIPVGRRTVRFEVGRVTIEPFDLRKPAPYHVVIDRLTHWYHTTREWIKKAVLLDGVYVFNNPWTVQSMEKQTTYCAMMRFGLPIPTTWLVPPKEYEHRDDLQVTLERYAEMFDLGEIGRRVGYPMYMKPYDGGAWRGVSRIDGEEKLRSAYDQSGRLLMHLQRSAEPWDRFVRTIGLGPQTRQVSYDPAAPLHDRYTTQHDFLDSDEAELLRDMTLLINAFFTWDFNSCEALRSGGEWIPIDFANPCPDSQVTSLHYHFPWLIMANIRWSVFVAASQRKMRPLMWDRFFSLVDDEMTVRERLDAAMPLVHKHFQTEAFDEFCAKNLSHLEEAAMEFFASDLGRDAVRQKVAALFPEHEVDQFTELFWKRIQDWRADQATRVSG